MTDTTSTDKTLRVGQRKPLSLKRDTDTVRQSFSGGRSKAVVVEKKRSRVAAPPKRTEAAPPPVAEAPAPAEPARPRVSLNAPETRRAAAGRSRVHATGGVVLRTLTDAERDAREHALQEARVREAEERQSAEVEARRRREEDERLAKERTEAERRHNEEEARKQSDDQARRRAEDEARRRLGEEAVPAPRTATATPGTTTALRPGIPGLRAPPKRLEVPKPTRTKAVPGGDRRRGRLTVTNALETSETEREHSLASVKRKREKLQRQLHGFQPSTEKIVREVVIPEAITVQELANRMAERAVDVIRILMKDGQLVKITDVLDPDTAQIVAEELGHKVRRVAAADVEEGLFDSPDAEETLHPRPPVVTIMGHVDHGKTSLLDAIRSANVVSTEAGGITQHIGAYQVEQNGQKITFIDTPGHEAFTAMRARGAQATDIAILVVAADDGVMPQTVESINHARAAKVPIIVAINKIDKQGADPGRVRTELLSHEIVVESLGGDTLEVEVSATKKTNLDKLLEAILLQAEVLSLQANPERPAEGIVVEAELDRGRGPVATVLVQRGTLRVGDIIVAGAEWGRVRALIDDRAEQVREAGPSTPVAVLGFQATPEAGDRLGVVENESRAREVTEYRRGLRRDKLVATRCRPARLARADDAPPAGGGETALPDRHQGRRAGLGRSDRAGAGEARHRRGGRAGHAFRRRRHHRIGREPRGNIERRNPRLQRPRQLAGARGRGAEWRRDPLLQRHLRPR